MILIGILNNVSGKISLIILDFDPSNFVSQVKYFRLRLTKKIYYEQFDWSFNAKQNKKLIQKL